MEYRLNLSQQGIWQNELVAASSAINVISLKLKVCGFSAEQVARSVDCVLQSADIFRAVLHQKGAEAFFTLADAPVSFSKITEKMSENQVAAFTQTGDKTPFEKGSLYDVSVIPTEEGATVYARFHHIIVDGYAMSLFSQRVLDALEGKPVLSSAFFDLPCDVAETEDDAFWTEYFDSADFAPSLFSGTPDGMTITRWGQEPPCEWVSSAEKFAAENGVTLPYVYLAALATYLAGATSKKEAVVLMPRLNRDALRMNVLGCFTLVVPVRVRVESNDSFADVCLRAKQSAQEASAHKKRGMENILKLCRENGAVTDGFSEYVFNYYRYRLNTSLDCSLSMSVAGAMHNHVTLNVFSFDGKSVFSYDLRKGIYTDTDANYLTDAILGIVSRGIEGAKIGDISLVGAKEKAFLNGVVGKHYEVSPEDNIIASFARVVAKHPDRMAVYAGEDKLTFAELDEMSDRIAAGLQGLGIKPGDDVAYLLYRDIRLLPTMFGVLKAGAAFVPIDPKFPQERVQSILEDSAAACLISSREVEGRPEEYTDIDSLLQSDRRLEKVDLCGESRAYTIYTSGTTGKPKGVMLAHRGIVNIVHPDNNPFNREITGLNGGAPCHGIVAVGSVSFDISLYEFFVPLLNGLFVELAPEAALTEPKMLAALLKAHGADIMHCTPSRLAAYLKLPAFSESFSHVRAVLSAGEVLHGSFADELRSRWGVGIFNGYGPTETTIGATITEAGDNVSIGKPIANMGILILDPNNRLLPRGAVGEICIFGVGMGLGYKNLPEKTAEKFCDYNGVAIYKTGDMGHLDCDGRVIYHGRNDRLIKLRGLRIELDEIEGTIASYEGVTAAVCIVKKINGAEHLVGFYTTTNGKAVDQDACKDHLRSKMPAYMVPDALICLADMPQTVTGKTDLKALAAYPVEIQSIYVAPTNETQAFICEKMGKVLGVEQVGITDSFFDLGGTSLDSAMLMIELEEKFGSGKVAVSDIYDCPTPLALAEKILGKQGEPQKNPLDALNREGIDALLAAGQKSGRKNLGNVLITGVTGYLGVHILMDLLQRGELFDKIYCLARPKGKMTAQKRVKGTLFYYGEDDFSDVYGEKWEVLEGDITNPSITVEPLDAKIDTVINCAANVAHFAHDDSLEQTNTAGVKNLIRFCLEHNALLCQVSTISVGGVYPADSPMLTLTENDLFIGQQIHNKYIYSKFAAEYEMLRAAVDDGLQVRILRVGNLQGRIRDGEFQMNSKTNAFTRQISSYVRLGAVPRSLYEGSVNFSPIDEVAKKIVTLCASDTGRIVFHVYPPQEARYAQMFATIRELGFSIEVLEDGVFEECVQSAKQTEEGKKIVEGILMERPDLHYCMTLVDNALTEEVLTALADNWEPVTPEYLKQYFTILNDMDMF